MTNTQLEMGKSLVAISEKVSNHIPNDVAFSILSKLSLKSLSRFGCAHKSWSLLFEDPHFMNIYRNNFISKYDSYYGDASILLQQPMFDDDDGFRSSLYLLSGERFENKAKLDLALPLQEELNDFAIILGSGSVNGILCLTHGDSAALWNPSTGEFKIIPPSPIQFVPYPPAIEVVYHGFGYVHAKNDYKVIRYTYFFQIPCDFTHEESVQDILPEPTWEIYNIQSNSWKTLDVEMPIASDGTGRYDLGYLDGMCHWLAISDPDIDMSYNFESCLVSFDLDNGVFFMTAMPSDNFDSKVQRYLVVLNGSLAVISHYNQMSTFHISILGEIGVKESWIKLFLVESLSYVEHPIGVGKKGDIFFIREDGELVCFNLSTKMVVELDVKGADIYDQVVTFKKSLLPIGE